MGKIQNKILIMFLLVIIIPTIIVSVYFTLHIAKFLKQNEIAELQRNKDIKVERISQLFLSIENDLKVITSNVALVNFIDASTEGNKNLAKQCKHNLELMLKAFSENKGIYDKICYLDESGIETVRVDLLHKGYADIVPFDESRESGSTNYVYETVKLREGKIYVSERSQIGEDGEINLNIKPALIYAIPLFDKKKIRRGILVFDVAANCLLENISSLNLINGIESILLDKNGNYLLNTDPAMRLYGTSDSNSISNIKSVLSHNVVNVALSGNSGIKMVDNMFLSFIPIRYDNLNSRKYMVYIESLDKSKVFSQIYTLYKIMGIFVLLLMTGVVIATLVFSKKLTKPLNKLVKGAIAVAKGDLDYYINVKSNDELELLTFSFNKMVANLSKARKQLQDYTHNLEQKVADKTAMVNEKLKKSEVLVEVGQVLWDQEVINKTMDLIVNLTAKALNYNFCAILLLDETNNLLRMVSGVGWEEGIVGNATVDARLDPHISFNLNKLKPVVIKNIKNGSDLSSFPILVDHGVVSGISVPMIVGDHVIGVMGVYSDQFTEFPNDDINFLQSVSCIVAAAIENRRAGNEIESKNEYTNNLIETTQDAIISIDDIGRINIWNKSAEMVFGYAESEIIGLPITKIIPDRYKKQHEDGLKRYLKTGEFRATGRTIEIHGINKKGIEVPLEMSLTAQEIEGEKTLFTAIIRDLTERKKMEGALLQSEKLKSIGTMTAGISHEFNNILAIISGNVQLLEMKYKDHGKLTEGLSTIWNATKDGVKISNRMLKFSKKEKDTTGFTLVEINDLITQSIDFTMPRWKNMSQVEGLNYHMDIKGIKKVPLLLCNPTEIREVFVNIINNALDAMPDGGSIVFCTWSKNDNVFVGISDTGVGMSDDIVKNIFDPFFTTKIASGTGLGMSTSYGIISRHGGKINVESQMGKGSTFTLRFPTATSSIGLETLSQPTQETQNNGLSILVIDDEIEICSMLDEFLKTGGHKVKTVDNGSMAIEITRKERFDLVLCDMAMPKISGQEVVRALNKLNNRPKIGIITGWDNDLKLKEDEGLVIDFIIKKPFNFAELTRYLNNIACTA
ncbi:MAG: PAS domain S-box protein [Candidatus Brocadiaceae bacterium]|nr:PAS domain S-box protein [Candidatus Brocadiaceae bacterium]